MLGKGVAALRAGRFIGSKIVARAVAGAIAGTVAGALALAASAQAQTYKAEYKLSTIVGAPLVQGVAAEKWASLVRERTQGRINIRVYPNSTLVGGDQTREFTALRQGVIDLSIGAGISWSPQVKELNVFSLPFLVHSTAIADAMVAGDVGQYIFERIRALGVTPLAWGDSGFRIVANSKHPIRRPSDLKGLKIRVIGSPLFGDFYSHMGANPTQMSTADMQPALATQAVDGADQSVEGFVALKLPSLKQKHLTLLNHTWEPYILSVNTGVWESWSPADRAIVQEAAVVVGKDIVAAKRKGLTAEDDSLIREIGALGVEVVVPTAAEIKAFQEDSRPIYEKWAKQLPADLVAKAERTAAGVGP